MYLYDVQCPWLWTNRLLFSVVHWEERQGVPSQVGTLESQPFICHHPHQSSSRLLKSQPLSVIECHRDEVRELPPKAEMIAWSEKTGVEMFRYGDHMMGIQGHPEHTKDILLHLIDRLMQRSFIVDSYADELKANLGKVEPDKDAWKKLCTSFLKDRL
ncbi:hypothetical protein CRYUN_Cryun18bG0085100 [Craigia yunnanensis]